jgi:L-alanine-DL-glutamate epimerase-like enolase superfamily enzyme
VRDKVGPGWEIMTDANQGSQSLDEAIRRARAL